MAANPDRLDPSSAARELVNTGRGALVGVIAGAAWMAWGLFAARALEAQVIAVFSLTAGILLACCGYCIVKGGRSRPKKYFSPRHSRLIPFLIVTILEAAGISGVVFAAQRMERLDLLACWIGLVVGLHFLALARVFQTPIYYVTGAGITLWCVLSWILFHRDLLTVWVCFGTGGILWATSSCRLWVVLTRRTVA